jgi:hypothetical protein
MYLTKLRGRTGESEGIAPHLLDVSGQLHAPPTSLPRKDLPVPIGYEVRWPESRSGRGGKEKNSLPLLGIEHRSSNPKPGCYAA